MFVFVTSSWTVGMSLFVLIVSCSWERKVSNGHRSSDGTHVEILKNLVEAQPPGGDRRLLFPRVEIPGDHIPFTPLD